VVRRCGCAPPKHQTLGRGQTSAGRGFAALP